MNGRSATRNLFWLAGGLLAVYGFYRVVIPTIVDIIRYDKIREMSDEPPILAKISELLPAMMKTARERRAPRNARQAVDDVLRFFPSIVVDALRYAKLRSM